ncbi:MAG: hypothetical protein QNJ40_12210 [Xanthomonadales bacterium]|nr:hypothetical protein [Xanthomonadales bacterium]
MAEGRSTDESNAPEDVRDSAWALGHLTASVFDAHVGSRFSVDLNTGVVSQTLQPDFDRLDKSRPVSLELVEVTRYPGNRSRVEAEGREPFSLLFRGPHGRPLVSALYTVSHPVLKPANLFLNPVQVSAGSRPGENPDGLFYESCFT